MRVRHAVELLRRVLPAYQEAITRTTSSPAGSSSAGRTLTTVACADASGLATALGSCVRAIDGMDAIVEDPSYAQLCLDAGIDPDDLAREGSGLTKAQAADRERKEIGDLGELLATLEVLCQPDLDPALVFPKNVGKLYQWVSEPGLDVVYLRMDLSSTWTTGLLPGDELRFVDCKTSVRDPHHALAREAAASLRRALPGHKTGRDRFQRELLMLHAELVERGAAAAAARLRFFLFPFHAKSREVRPETTLASPAALLDAPALGPLDDIDCPHLGITLASWPTGQLRDVVFRHRRSGA